MANSTKDEVFDGIGGIVDSAPLLHAYPEPQRSQILDYLFKPNYGQAVQVLKLEIGGDSNTTVDSESAYQHTATDKPNVMNGYEAWVAQEALKRNPKIKIWGLQWGAPRWIGGLCSKADNEYLVKWIQLMKSQAGVKVDYISAGQNEQNCAQGVNAAHNQFNDQDNISDLRNTLNTAGLNDVKVVGYDGEDGATASVLSRQPVGDLYAVGIHYPGGWKVPLTWDKTDSRSSTIKKLGMKYWASEDTDFQSLVPAPGSLTRQYNFRYIGFGTTLIMNWTLVGAAYPNMEYMEHSENPSPPQMALYAEEPWSGHYTIYDAPFWSMAHTTQFTEVGWQYVGSATKRLPKGGSIVSYRSGTGASQDWTSVIETTDATTAQKIHLDFEDGFKNNNFTVFSSSDDTKKYFENVGSFSEDQDGITVTVQPHSIVTISSLSGRAKGTDVNTSPPSAAFPANYADNFDSYAVDETNIGYFAPLQGAYAIQPCAAGRAGNCMTQVAAPNPIRWIYAANVDPYMLVGDRQTNDATYSVDVRLPDTQIDTYGSLGGHAHVGRKGGNYTGYVGYELKITGSGMWELVSTDTSRQSVASGKLGSAATNWHSLKLVFSNGMVYASIDGVIVAKAPTVSTLTAGMGALLSSYSPVQFDNFSIVKAGS
ncbi:hypothetical protein WS68_20160 [Burkholderia sp. TSV86]|nr:hypothetical protein WS68_20160 [Burkholderia sp. TSV86]